MHSHLWNIWFHSRVSPTIFPITRPIPNATWRHFKLRDGNSGEPLSPEDISPVGRPPSSAHPHYFIPRGTILNSEVNGIIPPKFRYRTVWGIFPTYIEVSASASETQGVRIPYRREHFLLLFEYETALCGIMSGVNAKIQYVLLNINIRPSVRRTIVLRHSIT